MKILIPVDSSAQSRRVLEILGEHESLVHAKPEIELVNVQYSVPEAIIKLLNLESVKAYYQAEGAKVFEAVGAEAFCRKTGAKTKVLYGEAAKAIVAEADAWQADLIVMGNRGLNPMRGLFLGSVSNGVLSQTRVPMLLLRENSKPVAGKRRIGIFVDGSPYGEAAAEYVLSHLELFGPEAEFEVVYAAEPIQEPIAPNPIGPINPKHQPPVISGGRRSLMSKGWPAENGRASMSSEEEEQDDLYENDPYEHRERIDGGIADRRIVALDGIVGIVQGHGIGHCAAEHAAGRTEVEMCPPQRDPPHEEYRQQRDKESESDPHRAFRPYDGFEEMGSGIESQTGQIHRESDSAQHQVCTQRGICNHVQPRAEGADENADDDRSAGEPESYGRRDAGQVERNCTECESENDADENCRDVGLVEVLFGISEHLLDVVHGGCFADDDDAVADLQHQTRCGQQRHAADRVGGRMG